MYENLIRLLLKGGSTSALGGVSFTGSVSVLDVGGLSYSQLLLEPESLEHNTGRACLQSETHIMTYLHTEKGAWHTEALDFCRLTWTLKNLPV